MDSCCYGFNELSGTCLYLPLSRSFGLYQLGEKSLSEIKYCDENPDLMGHVITQNSEMRGHKMLGLPTTHI